MALRWQVTRLRWLFFLLGLAILIGSPCGSSPGVPEYKAQRGFLDLSQHDFARQGVVTLGGEWLFFDKELREKLPASDTDRAAVVTAPQTWRGEGFGTYALRLKLPEGSENYKLHMEAQLSAYDVFVSGVKRAQSGRPGISLSETEPATAPLSAMIGQQTEPEILIRVANFHHRKGGLFKKIQLGTESAIDRFVERKRALDLILAGVLVMASAYFFIVFLYRPENQAELFFSIACLAVLGRVFTTGEKTLLLIWSQTPFALYTLVEYLSYFWGAPLTLGFFTSLYPEILHRWVLRTFYLIAALFSLVVIVTPLRIYSHTAYLYMPVMAAAIIVVIAFLILAYWRKKPNATLLLAGFLALALTLVNDMLNTLEILRTGYIVQYGFMAIVVCFAAVLAARFAKALTDTERAERELRLANETLEERVRTRTHELEVAKNWAEDANRQKDNLLAVVSHDLRSPLAGILNVLQALKAGNASAAMQQELLSASEKNAERMLKILESILAVRKMQLAPAAAAEGIFPAAIVRTLFDELSPEAEKRKIRLLSELPAQWKVRAKPELLQHVLLNLLDNAMKFTPAGGTVVVYRPEREEPAITVKDEGAGLDASRIEAILRGERMQPLRGPSGEKGSGLGLSLCREMLLREGGRLEIASEPGKGSAFTIVLANNDLHSL